MASFQTALIVLMVIVNFQVKKRAFVCIDRIGLSIVGNEIANGEETFTISSSWQVTISGMSTSKLVSQFYSYCYCYVVLMIDICQSWPH